MPMNRREFMAATAASAAMLNHGITAFAAETGNIHVNIDASRSGSPINPMVFGGYMEPATTNVWAEMLTDRKFCQPDYRCSAAADAIQLLFPPLFG